MKTRTEHPGAPAALSPFLPTLLLLAAFAAPAGAQPSPPPPSDDGGLGSVPEASAILKGQVRKQIPLAFPAAELDQAVNELAREAAEELDQTLRDDLEESRVFLIQGPWALKVLALSGDPARDLLEYRSLGNEILLLTTLSQVGDQVVFEGRLIDLKNGDSILGKRYRSDYDAARRVAHTFADEVIFYMGGRRSVALTSIAFVSNRTGNKEIYLMDYDGHGQRQISAHKSISMSPSWNASGDRIAYLSYFNGPPGIYSVDMESGAKRPLVVDQLHNLAPAYSADGRRVAFSRSTEGNMDVYTADVNGRQLRRITTTRAIDTNPAWSPVDDTIAFTSSRSGEPHIYLMDPDGSDVRKASPAGEYNDGAAWSPDGARLVYASRRDGIFQIAVTDLATLETRLLTSGPFNKETPSFSPDGQRIAFSARRGGRTQIYVMGADGHHIRQLTREGDNTHPSWSPYPARSP